MDSQMKKPAKNAAGIEDAALDAVSGGLNLGAAPANDTISPDEQLAQRKRCCSPRLKKENEKATPDRIRPKLVKEVTDKNKIGGY